jgi:multicomponent Na+:H+ antiporter subunit C
MEVAFSIAFGVMVMVATYLMLSPQLLRIALGLLVLSNAANLSLFIAGRLTSAVPPLVLQGQTAIGTSANPLPQALILTAIVISFALVAFAFVLFERAQHLLGTTDVDAMHDAEPPPGGRGERE